MPKKRKRPYKRRGPKISGVPPRTKTEIQIALRDWKRRARNKKFGVDDDWYDRTLAAQGGKCAICKRREPKPGKTQDQMRFTFDHNHTTGKLRGLLCYNCNLAIGHLKDSRESVRAAEEYLANHGEPE